MSLLLASQAEAQQPGSPRGDPEPDAPIVVTGSRLTREQVREQAVDYVQQVGVARGQLPTARWIDRVCPRVYGIAEPYAEIVEARMRAIAQAAGVPIAGKGCDPNISVSFAGNAEALMKEIDRRSPSRFRSVPLAERDALINGDAPIRWWYLTDERTQQGTSRAPMAIPLEGSTLPLQVNAFAQYSSSIVSTQINRVILQAGVVIDLDGADGRRLDAVAAYAAFVAFAEVRASATQPPDSILSMFGAEAQARGLTEQDMTFLRALYQLRLDRSARRHRGTLVNEIVNAQSPD